MILRRPFFWIILVIAADLFISRCAATMSPCGKISSWSPSPSSWPAT